MTGFTDHSDQQRAHWESLWCATIWERADDDRWIPLADTSAEPLAVITAWNPGGTLLPLVVNQARDAVLLAELLALGCAPLRARGRSPAGDWSEDGWLIPHLPSRTGALLRRYGQLAARITDAAGAHYQWARPPRDPPAR